MGDGSQVGEPVGSEVGGSVGCAEGADDGMLLQVTPRAKSPSWFAAVPSTTTQYDPRSNTS